MTPTVNRRTFLKGTGAVAVGAGAALAGCGRTPDKGHRTVPDRRRPDVLVVRDGGGDFSESQKRDVYGPFTEETGIRIEVVYILHEQMLTQIRQGRPQFDVMDIDIYVLRWFQQRDATIELDYDRLPSTKNAGIAEFLLTSHGVGKNYWASVMGYHADAFGDRRPESWADFWDTAAFPGRRSLQSEFALPELEFALLADGVAKDRLYPLDVDRAFASLDRIKDSIRTFWDEGSEPAEMLARRQVTAASAWLNRLGTQIRKGAPIRYVWNGARRQSNGYGIPKGAANPDAAYRFIDYALRPEVQARAASGYGLGPVTPSAYAYLSRSVAASLPSSPGNLYAGFDLDVDWWTENEEAVVKRWREWVGT